MATMRKGPRGATVQRQVEIKQTLTWTFTREELLRRLSLPADTVFYARVPADDGSSEDLRVDDDGALIAKAIMTRTKGADDGNASE